MVSYASLLIDTCTVRSFTEGIADAYGNKAKTWDDHLPDEPCRKSTSSGREITVGAEVVIAYDQFFLGDIEITEQDEIEYDGATYQILLVRNRQDGTTDHHKECDARVVR